MKFSVLLTVYKRNYIEKQLEAVFNQIIKPDYLIIFQNENHISIEHLKEKYKFIHVKSDFNTKYFGRFSYCLNLPVDFCIIMDDDIIPGKNCFKNYLEHCINLNGIIGGNGRPINHDAETIKKFDINYNEAGIRECKRVDFVGHLWCIKKDWLYYMFSIKPFTFDTGEDMHLCFSCKILGNINSYVAQHKNMEDSCDTSNNVLAGDEFASYRHTPRELRRSIPNYFIENFNLVPLTY